MERFARTVIGYHGCRRTFARDLLLGKQSIDHWQPSQNEWDWLGHGIYFWEHSPARALRWASERYGRQADVVGGVVQLGRCFDLLDESITTVLTTSHQELAQVFADEERMLPANLGPEGKQRRLDCLVINYALDRLKEKGLVYDTARGAFVEGEPVYAGAGFFRETHIQFAVRNSACILGIFRPNLTI